MLNREFGLRAAARAEKGTVEDCREEVEDGEASFK